MPPKVSMATTPSPRTSSTAPSIRNNDGTLGPPTPVAPITLNYSLNRCSDYITLLQINPRSPINRQDVFNHPLELSVLNALRCMPVTPKSTTLKQNPQKKECLQHLGNAIRQIEQQFTNYGSTYKNECDSHNELGQYLSSLKEVLTEWCANINSDHILQDANFPDSRNDIAENSLLIMIKNCTLTLHDCQVTIRTVLDKITTTNAESGITNSPYYSHLQIVVMHWMSRLTPAIA